MITLVMIKFTFLFSGLDKLSANFKDLYDNKETCDVALNVQDKEYKAHRLVLSARSRTFAATFKHDTLEKQTGVVTIPDCDPDSFHEFLEYLYSGELAMSSASSALSLYYTSDKYDVEEIKPFCVEYLIQHLSVENICEVVVFADKYDELELSCTSQDFFNKNVSKIFETAEWERLMQKDYRLASKLLKEMSRVKIKD